MVEEFSVQHDGYELVHFNFAMAKRPLDHPDMAGFTSQLDAVNRLASASPGFVWGHGLHRSC